MSVVKPGILLCDDTPANLVALQALLSDLDCDLKSASSGNDALKLLLKHDFALILLDVQMPGMDGYEVARHARNNPKTRDVPIIFLTALYQTEENVLRGYGSGAVDFLVKPINQTVLRSKVRVFLDLYLARLRLADTLVELDKARLEAERASRSKSQFVANMSHELKTPLNAIIGFGELLQDEGVGGQGASLNPKQREFVGHMVASGRHLLTLMNDILDLSRIEAGRIDLRREVVAIADVLQAARETVRPLALKRGIQLESNVPDSLPDLELDPVRITQVLYNLLSNSIKFTPQGGRVQLSAGACEGGVTISVEDSGIGISADDQKRLFREFERIEPSAGPRAEGTGLGLALVKRLVELHSGTVQVTSEPGRGSTFVVTLPTPTNRLHPENPTGSSPVATPAGPPPSRHA
jgi:signal transduction histidine kinase